MKYFILFILSVFISQPAWPQLTLDSCKALARSNYPVIRQLSLVEQSRRFTVSNASKAWLPQVSLSAHASYQSDVTSLPFSLPDVDLETLSKDQYDFSLKVSQQLYDGGSAASVRRVAHAQSDVEREKVNVSLYAVYGRVEQLFFGILVLDEQIRQIRLLQDDLSLSCTAVEGMMRGGVANQTDVDAVKVEQVKARQNEEALTASRHAYVKMLETFIGKPVRDSTVLVRPRAVDVSTLRNNRPELVLYDAQVKLLNQRIKALDTDLRPRIGLFAQGGYGNPALNMLKNGFDAYYKVGVTLTWNFGSLYTRGNDRRRLETERNTVVSERDAFLLDTRLQSEQQGGVLDKLQRQLELDNEIIELREHIRSKAETKVANGTETVNEMLRDINAVSDARLSKSLHEIQLLQESYKLRNINNF